jgi:DNA-binding IscR family transcriptional regulator
LNGSLELFEIYKRNIDNNDDDCTTKDFFKNRSEAFNELLISIDNEENIEYLKNLNIKIKDFIKLLMIYQFMKLLKRMIRRRRTTTERSQNSRLNELFESLDSNTRKKLENTEIEDLVRDYEESKLKFVKKYI